MIGMVREWKGALDRRCWGLMNLHREGDVLVATSLFSPNMAELFDGDLRIEENSVDMIILLCNVIFLT